MTKVASKSVANGLEISEFPKDWGKVVYASKLIVGGLGSGEVSKSELVLAIGNVSLFACGQYFGQPSEGPLVIGAALDQSQDLPSMPAGEAVAILQSIASHDEGTEGVRAMGSSPSGNPVATLTPLQWLALAKALWDLIRTFK